MTMGMGERISNRNHGGVRTSKFPASAKKWNTPSSGRGRNMYASTV